MRLIISMMLFMMATLAYAGDVLQPQVNISVQPDGSGQAEGSVSAARFSGDDTQFIACSVRAFATGATSAESIVWCRATDAQGAQAYCYTENPALAAGLYATNAFSYVLFRWNAAGECIYMGSSIDSKYMPDFRDLGLGAPGNSGGRGR